MKKFGELLESKKPDNSGYRVVKKTIYTLEQKDGDRWLHHSNHDSEAEALNHIKKAKAEKTRLNKLIVGRRRSWDNYDPGRLGPPRNPHGE